MDIGTELETIGLLKERIVLLSIKVTTLTLLSTQVVATVKLT